MANPSPTTTYYTIAGYDLKHPKPLLHRKAKGLADLQKLLDLAIHKGAVIVNIQRIHPPPQSKPAPQPGSQPRET